MVSKKVLNHKNVNFDCSRSHAVACVNQFIISRTQALMMHIDSFIEVGMHSWWWGGLSQIECLLFQEL